MWAARIALFLVGIVAPGIGLSLGGQGSLAGAESASALNGALFGIVVTLLAAIAFAFTLRTDGVRRLGAVVVFLIAIVASWVGAMAVLSWL